LKLEQLFYQRFRPFTAGQARSRQWLTQLCGASSTKLAFRIRVLIGGRVRQAKLPAKVEDRRLERAIVDDVGSLLAQNLGAHAALQS
jgi:hypothetical protein